MAVSKSNNGGVFTLTGTLAEVRKAINDEGVTLAQVLAIIYNGSNYDCFYKKGSSS
jgi:hypothetical protein